MAHIIDTRKNRPLTLRLIAAVAALRVSSAFRKPLTAPTCAHDDPPGLVSRTFKYRDGRVCEVRCHAKVMVGLLRAMLKAPSIEVTASFTSPYSGSYRTWKQQNDLYQKWLDGTGYKAANPCYGYHRRGRALDLKDASDKEKRAMLSVRVKGLRFYNGESFGDPPHYSFGAKG